MIVPMKKITLVVLDRERSAALVELRKLGVLHIEKGESSSQGLSDLQNLAGRIDQSLSVLAEVKSASKKKNPELLGREAALAVVDRVLSLAEERRQALDSISRAAHDLEILAPWGFVDPADFSYMESKGVFLLPYEIPVADFSRIPSGIQTLSVNRDKKVVRFLLCREKGTTSEALPESARRLVLPALSSADLESTLENTRKRIPEIESEIAAFVAAEASIVSVKKSVQKEIEFETVRAGMKTVGFEGVSRVSRNSGLACLTGFLPESDEADLAACAKRHGWAFLSDEPSDQDSVPTKLRNNRLVNLISPLLEFLGITPGYNEFDISMWFILFFGIFFAMIFGDGGYGFAIALISVFGILTAKRSGKKVPTVWFMLLYLGSMTVAWGVITCTWFGIPMENVPYILKAIALPAFSNENPDAPTNIKIFCFTLGLIQISLAHVIGVIRNIRSPKALGELGTLMMTVGMYFVVLNLVVDSTKYPLSSVVIGAIGAGFLLNFVFINYAGRIGEGILESLKNFITMFLGVVNVFGDIMSYIRLWAVGLAGAAISATVNSMVGPLFGGFLMFLAVLVLAFGHGLNFIMNILSVIVHGVRLNTLEFSNHLGLTWSGFKYEPFSETVRN